MKNWNRDCGWWVDFIGENSHFSWSFWQSSAPSYNLFAQDFWLSRVSFSRRWMASYLFYFGIKQLFLWHCQTTNNRGKKLQLRILTSEKKFPYQIFNEPSWLPETLIFFGKIDVTTIELNFKLSFMFLIELCRNFWKREIWIYIYNSNSGNVIFFGRNVMPICDNTVMDLVLWIWIHKWNIHSIFIKSSIYLSATSRLEKHEIRQISINSINFSWKQVWHFEFVIIFWISDFSPSLVSGKKGLESISHVEGIRCKVQELNLI